uniref:Uncharacterized protein n=1 Tax=Cucumis melo TaxID=3656 RepID=A0A9I9CYR2_CUCME
MTAYDNSIGRRGGMQNLTADVCERWMTEGENGDDPLDCSRETEAENCLRAVDGGGRRRR